MIIRQLADMDKRWHAAGIVQKWGFPRPVTWSEVEEGFWLTDEPQTGIAWLVRGIEENHWNLHAMPAPHTGLLLPCDETMRAIRVTAGLLGARRVYAALLDQRPGWQRWLLKTGWFEKRDELGPYMDLEG